MTEQTPQPTYRLDEIEAMLSMATTGEIGPDNVSPAIDVSQLTAHEIVSAVRAVDAAEHRVRQERAGEVDRRLAAYSRDIELTFEELPSCIGVEKTRDGITLLAGSQSPRDRSYAAHNVNTLTVVDHDYGLELWKRLLEDDNPMVAHAAWHTATYFSLDTLNPEHAKRSLAEDGLTWGDMADLVRTYVQRLEKLRGGVFDFNGYEDP